MTSLDYLLERSILRRPEPIKTFAQYLGISLLSFEDEAKVHQWQPFTMSEFGAVDSFVICRGFNPRLSDSM